MKRSTKGPLPRTVADQGTPDGEGKISAVPTVGDTHWLTTALVEGSMYFVSQHRAPEWRPTMR